MASLKQIKIRIKSAKSTQKITRAMKMVAASKLRRVRDKAEAAEHYADKLGHIVGDIAAHSAGSSTDVKLLAGTGDDKVHLIIAAASDRGLCGAFNSSILRAVKAKIEELKLLGKEVKIICVGKKSYDQLKGAYRSHIIHKIENISKKPVTYANAEEIVDFVLKEFDLGAFDVCSIFYNKFISTISQKVINLQLIPFAKPDKHETKDFVPYEYEPGVEQMLDSILPLNLKTQVYQALLENSASEQGARVSAMDSATRSAGKMINNLTLVYNRTRQASITKELIEIISGAEAI